MKRKFDFPEIDLYVVEINDRVMAEGEGEDPGFEEGMESW